MWRAVFAASVVLLLIGSADSSEWANRLIGAEDQAGEVVNVERFPSPCVVFFTQRGCGPCVKVDTYIVPWLERGGWTVVTVDVIDDPDTADEFGIRGTPVLMVWRNQECYGRVSGFDFVKFRQVLIDACERE